MACSTIELRTGRRGDDAGGGAPEGRSSDAVDTQDERVLRCARCTQAVAKERDRIEVEGRHVHTFVNPAGFDFTIGCFRDAAGCRGWGETSSFWSWFRGCAWQTALCIGCGEHVGWSFASEAESDTRFFGLILDRLV